MSRKLVYKCQASELSRNLFCGKGKASASCLQSGILGGKCADLVTSYAKESKTRALRKTETTHGQPREVPQLSTSGEATVQKAVSSQIKDILRRIRQFEAPRKPSKESQLEDLLVTHLRVWYSDLRTQLSYERTKIDAQIGRIGIEIKLSPDEAELDRLYGQIDKYLEHLNSVIAVIFYERSRESTESFKKRMIKRGWLDKRVFVLSL